MFASPFFTSGRASILPSIASKEELFTANSLTQLTQWTTVMIGSFLGGTSVAGFGYKIAFLFNAFSFVFSALCISRLHGPRGFRSDRGALTESRGGPAWHEYTEGLRYMRATPLILGVGLAIGHRLGHRRRSCAVLFSLFGEPVFQRGPAGDPDLGMRGYRPGMRRPSFELHRQAHQVRNAESA